MTTMTAFDAKCAFGKSLDKAQREPVTITQNGHNIGVMFAMQDLEVLARAFLSAQMLDRVREGRITISEALLREAELTPRKAQDKTDHRGAPTEIDPVRLAARRSVV